VSYVVLRMTKARMMRRSRGTSAWEHSSLLYSFERGNLDNKLFEISEDEANRIVERIRATVTGTNG
jgi:hypothetical protein